MNRSRTISSKWIKTKVLLFSKELRKFVPETRIYTQTNLLHMLIKHKMVYVKPSNGSAGHGLFASLNIVKLNRNYIVQQGIHLLTHHNQIFDTRIMVQKSPLKTWEATGYIGRVAHPQKIVTNFHNSGKALPLELLLDSYLSGQKKNRTPLFSTN